MAAKKPFEVKWGEEAHTILLKTFVDIATEGGKTSLTKHQAVIMAALNAHGYTFSWDAIRYVEGLLP